jgi:hypothetical protein
MSQHIYKTTHQDRPIEVLIGWDRPLQGFFMMIDWLDEENDSDEYLYSNLDDLNLQNSHPKELSYFLERLSVLGVVVPQKMLQEVLKDQRENAGNRTERYEEEGEN